MNNNYYFEHIDSNTIGTAIYGFIVQLFPICRSITGEGFRMTMELVGNHIPLRVFEVPSGSRAFDWVVPKEWNINSAYIKGPGGELVVDFRENNLHVLNYSTPVNAMVSLQELREHVYSLPDHPEWIPYKTSYYRENWGFCMSHNQLSTLKEGTYEVVVDSTLKDGVLNYGELFIKGKCDDEILISCHCCHPSLANDNLSGVGLATFVAKYISEIPRRYSYRFIFLPATIGAITWLSRNEDKVSNIKHGLVIAGVGDSGSITYKKSRQGQADIDRAACQVLNNAKPGGNIIDFHPYGYDERQFCSPGFNLPMGCFSRTPYGQYPEYHTSADNLDFIKPESLSDSYEKIIQILYILENNRCYQNVLSKCEPQLGRRGLYSSIGSNELAMLWVLNLSDGTHSLLDIAERSGIAFTTIAAAANVLSEHELLTVC